MKKNDNTHKRLVRRIYQFSGTTDHPSCERVNAAGGKRKRMFKRAILHAALFCIVMTACAPQTYLTLYSEPSGAHLYTKNDKFVGITPYTVRLNEIPQEARDKGVWELGELVAYKEGYSPVTRHLRLPLDDTAAKKKSLFQAEVTEWEFLFDFNSGEQERQSPAATDFFACNFWLDEDQNSCISRDEFRGVKDQFRAHEKITFVALLKQGAGVNYSYTLHAPDGSVYQQDENNQTRFKNAMAQAEFYVRELVDQRGVGQWKMQWKIEGNPVAITAVNLTR